jgi:hypothetical protein
MNLPNENFNLLLTDAASYMNKAAIILKNIFKSLFHVTCLSHLLHNCVSKIADFYVNVDELIARIKSLTLKNKKHKIEFEECGVPPNVIVTRWGSWLSSCQWYSRNFVAVKNIVENKIQDAGLIVERAKDVLKKENLFKDIFDINNQYGAILENIDLFNSSKITMKQAYEKLLALDFKEDYAGLKNYIVFRLEKNNISRIINLENKNIGIDTYINLNNCPVSSLSVERSFSLLKKLLSNDRNFNLDNILPYIFIYHNKII